MYNNRYCKWQKKGLRNQKMTAKLEQRNFRQFFDGDNNKNHINDNNSDDDDDDDDDDNNNNNNNKSNNNKASSFLFSGLGIHQRFFFKIEKKKSFTDFLFLFCPPTL